MSSNNLLLSLRRSKFFYNLQVKEAIKEFINNNPAVEFKTEEVVKYINQRLGSDYGTGEVLSILRELMLEREIPEYFEVVDEKGMPTGILKQRDAVHREGDWHLAVSILIFDKEGNLLLQKRAPHVAEPNRWEASASGHIAPGETPHEAIVRELKEEIGLELDGTDLILIGEENQFIKVGRNDVEEDGFVGDIYFHYSDNPSNNAERLTLFMYVVSDEEKKVLLSKFNEIKPEDVSEIAFKPLVELLDDLKVSFRNYSSALVMYFSHDNVVQYLKGLFVQERSK